MHQPKDKSFHKRNQRNWLRGPNVATFHYNLACYDCQLGSLEDAKARLTRAFELDPKFRLVALEDGDLEPLWDSIGR